MATQINDNNKRPVSKGSYYANLSRTITKVPKEDRKKAKTGGTQVLGVVCGRGYAKSSKTTKGRNPGAMFDKYGFWAFLGRPDNNPDKGIMFDETSNEIVFKMRDPDVVKANDALKVSLPLDQIPRVLEHRVKINQPIYLEIHNTKTLPGVTQYPCIVRFSGFYCRAWRMENQPCRFNLIVGSIYVPSEFVNSPSSIIDFMRKTIPFTQRYEQPTLYTAKEIEGVPHPTIRDRMITPPRNGPFQLYHLINQKDTDRLQEIYGEPNPDKGYTAVILDETTPQNSFYRRVGGVWDDTAANQDNCKDYDITIRLTLHIRQWDSSIDPMQRMPQIQDESTPHHTEDIQTLVARWPEGCWTLANSFWENWWTVGANVKFIPGMVLFRDNLYKTSVCQANIDRQSQLDSQGSATDTTLLANAGVRSLLLDIKEYLLRFGLPVSLKGACEILKAPWSETGGAPIIRAGPKGTYQDREGNTKTLNFKHNDVICLNEWSEDFRKVDARAVEYRVLTSFIPSSVEKLKTKIEPLVKQMTEKDTLEVCKFSRQMGGVQNAMMEVSDGKFSLAIKFGVNCMQTSQFTPVVFAILGPKSEKQKERLAKAKALYVQQWSAGPSLQGDLEGKHLNPKPKDELDLGLPPANKKRRVEEPEKERSLPATPTQEMEEEEEEEEEVEIKLSVKVVVEEDEGSSGTEDGDDNQDVAMKD